MQLNDRIVAEPEVMSGKPVVRGTRIPVEVVLAHLAAKPDFTDLMQAYPALAVDDIRACLAYAERQVHKSYQRSRRAATSVPPP
jgi:uncharacterized protein (DUF433 family)